MDRLNREDIVRMLFDHFDSSGELEIEDTPDSLLPLAEEVEKTERSPSPTLETCNLGG